MIIYNKILNKLKQQSTKSRYTQNTQTYNTKKIPKKKKT